jgi:hypothetical protein
MAKDESKKLLSAPLSIRSGREIDSDAEDGNRRIPFLMISFVGVETDSGDGACLLRCI